MSVTVAKKMFKGSNRYTMANDLRLWVVSQIPELKLVKSVTTGNYPWWLYSFGDTDYGVSFDWYNNYDYLRASFFTGITDASVANSGSYVFSTTQVVENGNTLYANGAIVVRTPHGYIIQGMNYAGAPSEAFIYFGTTNSAINGEITVGGYFSAASYVYSRTDKAGYTEHVSGSDFSFKINKETPAVWRHGVLAAICPTGTSHAPAGSFVASAVYGVTGTIWTDPIRIDAFYALAGSVFPQYYTEVTAGGRKMQRVGKELLLEG